MKVYLSHAVKDKALARDLAERLERRGFDVWDEEKIAPGENWAKLIGKALDGADLMVILMTPGKGESESQRRDIEFALGTRKYEGRVFSVFVGSELEADRNVPWILLKLPHRQVSSAEEFGDVVKEIQASFNGSAVNA